MAAKESRKRSRSTLQFEDNEEKLSLLRARIAESKKLLGECNNYSWIPKLIDFYDSHREKKSDAGRPDTSGTIDVKLPVIAPPSPSSGHEPSKVEIHTALEDDDGKYFIACKATIRSLVKGLTGSKGCCSVCGGFLLLDSFQMERRGHCGRISFTCENNHETVWFSSPILKSKYVANLRVIHGFMSSGLTETQYRGFTEAASLGSVEHTYLDSVFNKLGYLSAVQSVYEDGIKSVIEDIQKEQAYVDNDGDIIITDARHDSSRNAQHTTVTAMSYYTNKIILTINWSKQESSTAASREVPMTKLLIDKIEEMGMENDIDLL
ncbi:uncharacterized protein LOC116295571 [Actinia tenebrosa]|uniref:Uncharacterized protein LOC116295571 n=1 Tax=Actinia tenebrosa TaxID=6105 RepID=A0A6P8I376_ACTTE|nr:uncharacterized protein LOC116295571 [Actinia tenebrosa]